MATNFNSLLEVRYAYIDRNERTHDEYFLLDFVSYDKLEEFGKAIDAGARAAAYLVGD